MAAMGDRKPMMIRRRSISVVKTAWSRAPPRGGQGGGVWSQVAMIRDPPRVSGLLVRTLGRCQPKAGGADLPIPARLSPALVEALDAYAATAKITRSEAIRRLVEIGLAKGKARGSLP